ncbi:replication initiation protein [Pseudonocardia sp. ICBG601]|uniref:replication initiation protein n=1 Tax=Pseudonocardia sp. ICBG601 TaxID=2846759 RepID=UPI001CF6D001|nr:replication initiation protein [Pseudonocardia sp. ICBG601]
MAPVSSGEVELRAMFEGNWKPRRPYATDDLAWGIRRMGRDAALLLAHIEASPVAMLTFLIVDIDHPDALLRALSANGNHPMPNLIITNPFNGHAHAVWVLATPVCRTEYARRNVLSYAASVLEGLRRAVDGDRRYSGLLMKNPLAGSWATQYLHDHLWTLGELEAALQVGGHMPPKGWRQQRARKADPCGIAAELLPIRRRPPVGLPRGPTPLRRPGRIQDRPTGRGDRTEPGVLHPAARR